MVAFKVTIPAIAAVSAWYPRTQGFSTLQGPVQIQASLQVRDMGHGSFPCWKKSLVFRANALCYCVLVPFSWSGNGDPIFACSSPSCDFGDLRDWTLRSLPLPKVFCGRAGTPPNPKVLYSLQSQAQHLLCSVLTVEASRWQYCPSILVGVAKFRQPGLPLWPAPVRSCKSLPPSHLITVHTMSSG